MKLMADYTILQKIAKTGELEHTNIYSIVPCVLASSITAKSLEVYYLSNVKKILNEA